MKRVDIYHPASLKILRKDRDHAMRLNQGLVESPSAEEIAAAKERGVWRDQELIHHDEVIRRILIALDTLTKQSVADAFVVGVSDRIPALCSAVSSYSVAMHLAPHRAEYPDKYFPCVICGLDRQISGSPEATIDWNGSLLARHDTGGTSSLDYVLCDLEDFHLLPISRTPNKRDVSVIGNLLDVLRNQPQNSTPGILVNEIAPYAGKNKSQRIRLIEILAIIGILEPKGHTSFLNGFTPFALREAHEARNDWEYPSMWWRGTDGVNERAIEYWFSHLASV